MKNSEGKFYAATAGGAKLAEQWPILKFTINSFAATAAMMKKKI